MTLMKIKLVKNIMAPLVVACAFVAATAFGQGTQGGRLEGTWSMQITLTDCSGHVIRSFPTLVVFMAGGTLTEASGGTAPAPQKGGKRGLRHNPYNNQEVCLQEFTFYNSKVVTGLGIITRRKNVDAA